MPMQCALSLCLAAAAPAVGSTVIWSDDFDDGLMGWTVSGYVTIAADSGWTTPPHAQFIPAPGSTAELRRTIE